MKTAGKASDMQHVLSRACFSLQALAKCDVPL